MNVRLWKITERAKWELDAAQRTSLYGMIRDFGIDGAITEASRRLKDEPDFYNHPLAILEDRPFVSP